MGLIETLKEKAQSKKQIEIQHQAEDFITLSDFDSELYIAYQGTPLVPIQESWTSKEIVQELSKIRQNFINSRTKQLC